MNHSKRIGGRIAGAIGLAAIILAAGGAWADPGHDDKGHKDKNACSVDADCKSGYRCAADGKCHNAKDICTADTDCKSGYRCAPDGKCRNAKDVCRADSDCKLGQLCGSDGKCHDAKNTCRVDTDCPVGQRCAADAKCHKIDHFCSSNADCKKNETCGSDHSCHKTDPGACTVDTDCADGERCWDDGQCRPADKPCIADSDCKADQYCSDDGKCHKGDDCDDANGCTIDRFAQGHCIHYPIAGCQACKTGADCDDVNACTTDVCDAQGTCEHVTKDACARCTAAADCEDGNACTAKACAADGSCQITVIPNCPAPAVKPAEICGDCIDNDGNGLTDFEDPACCSRSEIFTMNLAAAKIVSGKYSSKVNVRSVLPAGTISGVNALGHDVYVQIRPATGSDLLCARIPAGSFKYANSKLVQFRDPKGRVGSAYGLNRVFMKLGRDGSVRLKMKGRRVWMGAAQQGPLQLTVGFANDVLNGAENRCSASLATFRAPIVKSRLVAP